MDCVDCVLSGNAMQNMHKHKQYVHCTLVHIVNERGYQIDKENNEANEEKKKH